MHFINHHLPFRFHSEMFSSSNAIIQKFFDVKPRGVKFEDVIVFCGLLMHTTT
jgi:hypothetical protein